MHNPGFSVAGDVLELMGFSDPAPQRGGTPTVFDKFLWRRAEDLKFVLLTDDSMIPAVEVLRSAARQAGAGEFKATLFGAP